MRNCFLKNTCGVEEGQSNIHKPLEDPLLAPFVIVTVKNDNAGPTAVATLGNFLNALWTFFTGKNLFQDSISVGNRSSPAVVKSFQYGLGNGAGATIEILDEDAGDFAAIYEKINRGGTSTGTFLSVRFGWISTDCNQSLNAPPKPTTVDPTKITPGYSSPELLFLIEKITLNYQNGFVKYTISCIDMLQEMQNEKVPGVFGTGKEPMHLTDAIKELLGNRDLKVEYKKFNSVKDGTPLEFDMTGDGTGGAEGKTKGPKRKWMGSNRNALECIMSWCSEIMCKGGSSPKGVRLFYEPTKPPRLIVMADIPEHCKGSWKSSTYSIGTYIVNGGACSPVIRFSPSIQMTGSQNAYSVGGTGGAKEAGVVPSKGPADCLANGIASPHIYNDKTKKIGLGNVLQVVLSEGEIESRVGAALRYSYNAKYMNNLANIVFGAGITAELTIQGNPNLSMPIFLLGRFVRLVIIQPYKIGKGCAWTNGIKGCNEILSNENWMIEGVFHSIQPGSFTTTLKLRLLAPGADIAANTPIGAAPGAK